MLHATLLSIINRGKNYTSTRRIAGLFAIVATGVVLMICIPNRAAAQGVSTLTCSSDNGQRVSCPANTRGGVRMVRQLSGSPCQEGSTWGYDARGIWVDRGCRAEFEIMGGGPGRFGNFNGGDSQGLQRRAQLKGNGNSDRGKCTVEVVVDGAVEVEIRGDNGLLRNLSGQPPQWRRFECTGPLPANVADFRFSGVDGRGRQQLVNDPRNDGVAVVRIEDPQSGSEGYTFDITWSGGTGYPNGSGLGSGVGQYGGRRSEPRVDRGRPLNRQFSTDDAVRACQDAVRQQAAERFNTSNVEFQTVATEDNRGARDVVRGTFAFRRGSYGRDEIHQFSCSVNFDTGQVRSVQIDASQDGRYAPGYDNRRGSSNQAIQQCERAVQDRLRRDGYDSVEFESMHTDDRSGRNDVMVGNARASRGNGFDTFEFYCSLDLNYGNVRSVDVRRR